MTSLTGELSRRGMRVATIKHDGHDFEPDVPGTDSWKHRKAGAYAAAVFSSFRVMLTREWEKPELSVLLQAFSDADVILVEGLKDSDYPKVFCAWPRVPLPDPVCLADRILAEMGRASTEAEIQSDGPLFGGAVDGQKGRV